MEKTKSKKNRGKKFEENFKENWKKHVPDSLVFRLVDQQSKYKGSTNPCDFICFKSPKCFLVECKSFLGNTFSLYSEDKKTKEKKYNLRQYQLLLDYANLKIFNLFPGVILWFQKYDKVCWIDIKEIERMIKDGNKSINIKMLKDKVYNILEIPSTKKVVYMDSDYSVLSDLKWEDLYVESERNR